VLTLDPPTPDRVMAAARIKAQHPLAYADAFAVATAAAHDAVLLTGDPGITRRKVGCRVEDLSRG
jgi:predicted nucleic acid-binding protein